MNNIIQSCKIKVGEYIYLKLLNEYKYITGKKDINEIYKYKDCKKIILTLLPTHGNLGDHAIAYATKKYLEDNFKEYHIIELDMNEIYMYGKALKNILTKDDYIFTLGGGNMGNLYHQEEWTRRFIIKTFKDTPIVSLPQTINFTKDNNGKREFKRTKKIYNQNRNLTIIGREEKSFNIMKDAFRNANVILNPDIVFYLENMNLYKNLERENIMICLRQDKEGYISLDKRAEIIDNIKSKYKNVIVGDTVINKNVNKNTREYELKKLWRKFYESKIVVTDRLHGMIFAMITKTPCIVIRNTDHKIIGSYKWIENLNYIKLMDNFSYENIEKNIEELLNINIEDDSILKAEYFDKLKEKII